MDPLLLIPIALLGLAAASDIAHREIPNWIALALAGSGLVWLLGFDDAASPAAPLTVAALVLLGGLGLYALGWMGGGDVKLAASAMLWTPPAGFAAFLVVTSFAGAALALLVFANRFARASVSGAPTVSALQAARTETVPYGVAIAVGVAFVLLGGR